MLGLIVLGLAAVDGLLLYKRARYREETTRLRAGMSEFERAQSDAIVAAEADRTGLILQLARRQSFGDEALHLAVSSESSFVALDRGGVRLRTMAAQFMVQEGERWLALGELRRTPAGTASGFCVPIPGDSRVSSS